MGWLNKVKNALVGTKKKKKQTQKKPAQKKPSGTQRHRSGGSKPKTNANHKTNKPKPKTSSQSSSGRPASTSGRNDNRQTSKPKSQTQKQTSSTKSSGSSTPANRYNTKSSYSAKSSEKKASSAQASRPRVGAAVGLSKGATHATVTNTSKRADTIANAVGHGVGYIGKKHAETAAKIGEAANKRAVETAGKGKGGSRGGVSAPTKSSRLNEAQKSQQEKFRTEQKERKAQEKAVKAGNHDNYYSATTTEDGIKVQKKGKTEGVKTASDLKKKMHESAEKSLEKGASGFSGEKHKVKTPFGEAEVSAKDIYKGGVKLANEMVDYAIPYGGTTKGAMKAAEAGIKAGKAYKGGKVLTEAAEKGGRTLTEGGRKYIQNAMREGLKQGKPKQQILDEIRKEVMKSNAKTSIKKELIANAMQDASIGTGIDFLKGIDQEKQGGDMAKYMAENAVANLAIGAPIAAVAGRTGKAGKAALSKDMKTAINNEFSSLNKVSRADAKEVLRINAKDEAGLSLTDAEIAKRDEVQRKNLENRGGIAQIDRKGKLVTNNNGVLKDAISPGKLHEFTQLNAKVDAGVPLTSGEADKFNKLNKEVAGAYKAVERNAEVAVKLSKTDAAAHIDLDLMDGAVNFYRQTDNAKGEKQAVNARTKVAETQFNTDKTTAKFITTTVDRSDGNILIRPMDEETARNVFGLTDSQGFDGVTVNINGKKVVLLNPNSQRGTAVTLGHELTHHVIEGDESFIDAVRGYSGSDWNNQYVKTTKPYETYLKKVESGEINPDEQLFDIDINMDEETACDLMGRYIEEKDFYSYMLREDKSAFQKMKDYVKKIMTGDEDFAKDAEFKSIADRFEDAYNNSGKEGAARFAFKDDFGNFAKSRIIINEATGKPVSNDFQSMVDLLESVDTLKKIPFDKFERIYDNTPEIIEAKANEISGSSLDEALTPERQALRKKWADEAADYGSVVFDSKGKPVYKGEVEQGHRVDIVIGGTGSGKSTLANNISAQHLSRIMDSDDIKKLIKPLYGRSGNWMDGYVHDESKDVIYDAILKARDRGDNITMPICGDKYEKVEEWADFFKEKGYEVHLHLNELPPAKAAARTLRRMARDERYVDILKTVFEIQDKPNGVLEQFVKNEYKEGGLLDGWTRYSNDVAEGEPPKRVGGTEDVSFNSGDNAQGGRQDIKENTGTAREGKSGEEVEPAKAGFSDKPKANFALSDEKKTLHGGKGSANEYLSLKKVKKAHAVGNQVAIKNLKKQTGWYQENGKWQFDIDISNMSFKNGIKQLAKKGEKGGEIGQELGGIDAVLKNYPDLEYASIGFGDAGGDAYKFNMGGKNLYGIVLDSGLLKVGLPKKEKNQLINDTVSDALQDVLNQIDEGKIARADAEDYAEDLFDDEGLQKLTNISKKPTYNPPINSGKNMQQGDVKDMFDRIVAEINRQQEDSGYENFAYTQFKDAKKAELESLDEQQALDRMEELGFHIYTDVDGAINFGKSFDEFKKIILENGDLNPTKDSIKQFKNIDEYIAKWTADHRGQTPPEVAKKMAANDYCDWVMDTMSGVSRTEAAMRIAYFAEVAGIPDEDAAHLVYSVWRYTSNSRYSKPGSYDADVAEKFQKFIDGSPAYAMSKGEMLYHGVGSTKDWKIDHLEDIWNRHGPGVVLAANKHLNAGPGGSASSWSNSRTTAEGFANWGDDNYDTIFVRCHNCITGAPIQHISKFDNEQEVLFGPNAQWTLLNFERVSRRDAVVDVIEKAPGSAKPRAVFALTDAIGETPAEAVAARSTKPQEPKGDVAAEATRANRPMELRGVIDRAKRLPTEEEMNQTAINMIEKDMEKYGGDEGFTKMIDEDIDKRMFGKYNKVGRAAAASNAIKELEDLGYEDMLEKFLKSDFDEDPYVNAKRATVLRNEISRMIEAGEGSKSQLYADSSQIVSKMSSYSGFSSHVLNAMKEFATATPEGRVRNVYQEIARLEKRYADRINGGKLIVDEKKLEELAEATGARKDELLHEINKEIWDQIPATLMERMNEYRHCFMLFNARTHGRNMFGNAVFRVVRAISDEMEAAALKASKGHIEKLGKKTGREVAPNKVHVSRKEVYDNRGYLENEFHDIYDKSGSRNKYIEMGRPDYVDTVKFKPMQKLINLNYSFLEKEDIKGALKPAFNKAYVSYCKARCPEGKDLREFMESMSAAQKEKARQYAMFEGEYATFRDTCAFSDWLIGKKQTFAGKEGKTKWGTFGYRTLDAVLEGAVPFVKTPVNIFRRSVDYSPASILFSVGKLTRAKSAEEFMTGVHQFCTGLTGTGIMGVGVYLAHQGMVTVKTGEESGDEFYDRDMGFQDYSIRIHLDDKEYSATLDWLAPTGMSLFAGAAFAKMFEKDGFDNQSALNALFACTSPITDMSFMSSPKETYERFVERATRDTTDGKDVDMAGALAQLLLGDVPKNYVSGFAPQLMAQTAGFLDPVQRDTRSTAENVYVKGWQSSARQLLARVPGFRKMYLNPKLNREGQQVENGGNIATRFLNAFINPANVKEITMNDTDRELINIRNHMDKNSRDYKYFYYNFTGNPSYDLADGKRMTYNEAYEYGKANRIEQNDRIKVMLNADSYGDMTWDMKADEVDDAHWIGTTKADLKTYGANYAMKSMLKNNDKETEAVKEYKRLSGLSGSEANERYMKYYLNKERILSRSHATGDDIYRIKAIAAIETGDRALLQSQDIHKSKINDLTHYWGIVKGESKTMKEAKKTVFKELTDGCCRIMSRCIAAEVSNPSKGAKSTAAGMAAADGNQIAERVYRAYGHNWNCAQAGGGLMLKYNKDGKYSIEKVQEMRSVLRNQYDVDNSGSLTKKDVVAYIDSLGVKSDDEKACLYEVLYNGGQYKNPYKAEINDHLKWGENRDDEWGQGTGGNGRGWGRRGWGHGWGGWGGGGSGASGVSSLKPTKFKAGRYSSPEYTAKLATTAAPKVGSAKATDYTEKSNLDDAYRKKLSKLRENMRKKHY